MFNYKRLVVARKRRGLSKIGMASQLGLSIRIVTEYESGRREPAKETISRVAGVLDFPEAFFEGEDLELPASETVTFRARATLSARDRDQALGGVAIANMLSDYLEMKLSLPPCDVPDLMGMRPEGAAQTLRTAWGIGERPIGNMVHLLESKGVRVFSLVESSSKLDAFALWRSSVPYVFLNVTKSAERTRFDAAHELAHLVLHREGRMEGHRAETEANRFASAFLMPEPMILALRHELGGVQSLVEKKRLFGVSVSALAYRLWDLKLITDWHYHTLCVQLSQLGYRTQEPDPMPPESSQLFEKALHLLREDGIGHSALAAALDVNQKDMEELIFGLTLVPLGVGRSTGSRVSSGARIRVVPPVRRELQA